MQLHLFCTPGENLSDVIEASRPYLEGKDDPMVAYMPLASLYARRWYELNQAAYKGLARLVEINAELMNQKEIEDVIREAVLVYITGGNTFLLNHRLHISGVMPYLKKKVQNGLPVVGVSAGMILCGPNILTSTDMNTVEAVHFDGLNASPFNFLAHYDADAYGQSAVHDDWVAHYHVFHDNAVVMLNDGAYVKMDGKKTILVRGNAWVLRKDSEKEKLVVGETIVP